METFKMSFYGKKVSELIENEKNIILEREKKKKVRFFLWAFIFGLMDYRYILRFKNKTEKVFLLKIFFIKIHI